MAHAATQAWHPVHRSRSMAIPHLPVSFFSKSAFCAHPVQVTGSRLIVCSSICFLAHTFAIDTDTTLKA